MASDSVQTRLGVGQRLMPLRVQHGADCTRGGWGKKADWPERNGAQAPSNLYNGREFMGTA